MAGAFKSTPVTTASFPLVKTSRSPPLTSHQLDQIGYRAYRNEGIAEGFVRGAVLNEDRAVPEHMLSWCILSQSSTITW